MRRWALACLGAVALAGCQTNTGAAVDPVQRATSHGGLAASVGEAFIWDCTLTEAAGSYPPQFILQRQDAALRPFVMMLEAGAPRAQRMEVTPMNFARRFTLPDSSAILISSSGEVFAVDVRNQPIEGNAIGQCRKGSQPI